MFSNHREYACNLLLFWFKFWKSGEFTKSFDRIFSGKYRILTLSEINLRLIKNKLSSSALLKLVNDGNEVTTSSYSSTSSASGLLPGLSLTPKELQYRDSIYIVLDQVRLIYRVFIFIKSN